MHCTWLYFFAVNLRSFCLHFVLHFVSGRVAKNFLRLCTSANHTATFLQFCTPCQSDGVWAAFSLPSAQENGNRNRTKRAQEGRHNKFATKGAAGCSPSRVPFVSGSHEGQVQCPWYWVHHQKVPSLGPRPPSNTTVASGIRLAMPAAVRALPRLGFPWLGEADFALGRDAIC